eukprot:TRINITY_DN19777_c0_g1_i2.p1 TRINITY_DN19777_c0_g1~~TRINITY_DN19777_c0_g1_i2.p1  ORF type:complete len:350 (+),score=28.34 TRINITY_DN19777_c0_g1_i2:1132-2181(+)
MVFLDKLCIHQTDEQKKEAGILALAGFLRTSQRMILLWTPRYFSRLWCAYELASWFHFCDAAKKPIKFMPISYAAGILAMLAWLSVFFATRAVIWLDTYVICILFIPGIGFFLYSVISTRKLFDQISAFKIRSAECFCCTHNHVHPETGKPIVCDREMVHNTLADWLQAHEKRDSKCSFDTKDCLDTFDHHIRRGLATMLRANGVDTSALLPYQDALIAGTPFFWAAIDDVGYYVDWYIERGPWEFIYQFEEWGLYFFIILPCTLRSMLLLIVRMEKARPTMNKMMPGWAGDLLVGCSAGFAGLAIASLMWLTGPFLVWHVPMLRFARFALFGVCTALCFRHRSSNSAM